MFFLNSCDKISQFIDRKPEIFDNFVHGGSEGLVVRVHEDVVDATVLEQVLLKKQDRLRCFKDCARCFKDLTSYLGLLWGKECVGVTRIQFIGLLCAVQNTTFYLKSKG